MDISNGLNEDMIVSCGSYMMYQLFRFIACVPSAPRASSFIFLSLSSDESILERGKCIRAAYSRCWPIPRHVILIFSWYYDAKLEVKVLT